MFRTDFIPKVGKVPKWVLCIFSSFLLYVAPADAQVMVCDDQVNISLGETCEAMVTVDMILEGENSIPGFDPDDYQIQIEGHPSVFVSTPGIYTVTVTEMLGVPPYNNCWGHILVEDKLPPVILDPECQCPEGNTDPDCQLPEMCIDLLAALDENIDVPKPTAMDNCTDVIVTFQDNVVPGNTCDETIIMRSWIFTAENGNSTTSCVHEYRVGKIELDPTQIVAPKQNVALTCGAGYTPADIYQFKYDEYYQANIGTALDLDDTIQVKSDANDYALMFSYPVLNGIPLYDNICNTVTTYTDDVIPICGSGCGGNFKVRRTWTIYDWCDPLSIPLTYWQLIKAADNTGPTIEVSGFTKSVDPWGCTATFYMPEPEHLYDDCSGIVTYEVITGSGSSDIQISYDPNYGYLVSNIGVGSHYLYYRASDCCDNVTTVGVLVDIVDKTPPIAVAKQNVITSLIPDPFTGAGNGVAKIYAESIDNGSYDGCGPVKLEIRRTGDFCNRAGNSTYNNDGHIYDDLHDGDNGSYITFCCEDLTENGVDENNDGIVDYSIVKVWLRVWDDGDKDGVYGSAWDNYSETWAHVRVEDKSGPSISCPPDVTILCSQDVHDLALTGQAVAANACGIEVPQYIDEPFTNTCGVGEIRRKWYVNGSPEIYCYQNITVAGSSDVNIEVYFPKDTVIDCTESLSSQKPHWTAGACDLIGYSVETDTFYFEDGACFKILKYWTVINWCTYDPAYPYLGGIWSDIQVIKIYDNVAPSVLCSDAMFEANDYSDSDLDGIVCENNSVMLTASASDNGDCASKWIRWTVQVDLWGDWSVDYTFSSSADPTGPFYVPATSSGESVKITLPEGVPGSMINHRVLWKASDGCGNVKSCTSYFMVVDKKPPTPYCVNLSTALMDNGQVELWACDFDLGSFDNCTSQENLRYTFSSAHPDVDPFYNSALKCSSKLFTCDDVDSLSSTPAIVEVQVYIWDEKDNYDACTVFLTLIDNQGACSGTGSMPLAQIEGSVTTEYGASVEDVQMELVSVLPEYPASDMTDTDGHYAFEDNPMYVNYNVSAYKNDDPLNGVSTLDLVLIQRHILGQEDLGSPYKMIAADINNDQKVSSIDLVELRKLILGVYTDLPNNTSWRFVDSTNGMNPANPWPVDEVRSISGLDHNMMQEDFTAIKVGDVNHSASTLVDNDGASEYDRPESVVLNYADKQFSEGEVVDVVFSASKATALSGMQFTLSAYGLELVSAESGQIPVHENNIAVHESGDITFSWNDISPVSFGDNIFTLRFRAKSDGSLGESLNLSSRVTHAEAYEGTSNTIIPVQLTGRNNSEHNFALYQNTPNPFNDNTTVEFSLPQSMSATLTVYDLTGKSIWSMTSVFEKGLNLVQVNKSDLNVSGVMYYELNAGGYKATRKLIVLD